MKLNSEDKNQKIKVSIPLQNFSLLQSTPASVNLSTLPDLKV